MLYINRKRYFYLISIISILFLLNPTNITYANKTDDSQKTVSEFQSNDNNIDIAIADGNVEQHYIDDANKLLEKIPENILEEFKDNEWEFYITDKNLADTFYKGIFPSVQGVTDYDNHKIYIEDRDKAINGAVIHEFGHYLDHTRGKISNTKEFKKIYEEENETFKKVFNVKYHFDILEFFAEGFAIYINGDSDLLKEECPGLYETIQKNLEKEK